MVPNKLVSLSLKFVSKARECGSLLAKPTNIRQICCLYYKHIKIINDALRVISKWRSKLWHHSDDHNIFMIYAPRVINYARKNIYSTGTNHDNYQWRLSYFYGTGRWKGLARLYALTNLSRASLTKKWFIRWTPGQRSGATHGAAVAVVVRWK
jgi:hypothetical protein